MTRVNVGIRAYELTDQHLMAEYREILRIPKMAIAWVKKNSIAKVCSLPNSFSLGTGHVKFFYNKLAYIDSRFEELYSELKKREYKVQKYDLFNNEEEEVFDLYDDYNEQSVDRLIVAERIRERLLTTKSRSTYYGYNMNSDEWYDLISHHSCHLKQVSLSTKYDQKSAF